MTAIPLTACVCRDRHGQPLLVLEGSPFNGLELSPADLLRLSGDLRALARITPTLISEMGKHFKPRRVTFHNGQLQPAPPPARPKLFPTFLSKHHDHPAHQRSAPHIANCRRRQSMHAPQSFFLTLKKGASMNSSYLFPKGLLVLRQGQRVFTTSLKVAECFRKQHKNVLQSIDQLIAHLPDEYFPTPKAAGEFRQLNFQPAQYLDAQKKPRPIYELSEEGFALVAMGFTGSEALVWKLEFLQAFMAQRTELARLAARYVRALDQVRPSLRPVAEATEAGQSRAVIAQHLGKSVESITYHRGQARRFGLLAASA